LLLQVQDGQLPTQALSHLAHALQVLLEQSRHSQLQLEQLQFYQQQQLQSHLGHNHPTSRKAPAHAGAFLFNFYFYV